MKSPRGKRLTLLLATFAVVVLSAATCLSWSHLRFWWLFEPMGVNEKRYGEYRHRQTGIVMVRVPGGTFWMGAQKDDPKGRNYDPEASADEGPVHQVTLDPFLIGKYEVTQGEWKRVAGIHGDLRMPTQPQIPPALLEKQPVLGVSWEDCSTFCRKTSLELPTEAQWEYACRAGAPGPIGGTGVLDEMAWYAGNSGEMPHPVGEKRANAFGLHDVHGNASEWCVDVFEPGFYSRAEVTSRDPVCEEGAGRRVNRGGSAFQGRERSRAGARTSDEPTDRDSDLGFRVAFYPVP